ncbi:hypothetical protein MHB73_20980 [Bacillus sp. FSL K6-6483]
MKDVMKLAWAIARKGARKFGGSPVEYLSEALKMAWKFEGKNVKRPLKSTSLTLKVEKGYYRKSWVARITGKDATYKFERSFVKAVSQSNEEINFDLASGLYEVCDAGTRYFVRVKGGKIERINEQVVKTAVA